MHLSIIPTLLITLLSAGALSVPSTTPESNLRKRDNYAWVGYSYDITSLRCEDVEQQSHREYGKDFRPKIKPNKNGISFDRPGNTNIKIFWGTGMHSIPGVNFYLDKEFKDVVFKEPIERNGEEKSVCINVSTDARPWKGVKIATHRKY